VKGYKGFDKDFKCRGKQYAVGQAFEEDAAELCKTGMHFCEHPLDCLVHYPPRKSRYAEIEAEGVSDERSGDSKRVAKKITVARELSLQEVTEAVVQVAFDRAAKGRGMAACATGDYEAAYAEERQGAACATGFRGAALSASQQGAACSTRDYGAALAKERRGAALVTGDAGVACVVGWMGSAFATGDLGAALAKGRRGAALATGSQGEAFAMGDRGVACALGHQGAASAKGENSAAFAFGTDGKAAGALGCWIALAEWELLNDGGVKLREVKAALVDGEKIKPDTFYMLKDGDFVEAGGES
jgi:hypothetical protein